MWAVRAVGEDVYKEGACGGQLDGRRAGPQDAILGSPDIAAQTTTHTDQVGMPLQCALTHISSVWIS